MFATHHIGAGIAAGVAGLLRTTIGTYDTAWYGAAVLCMVAATLSLSLRRPSAETTPTAAPIEQPA